MSGIFLWTAQSKIFVGAFYASSAVSFQPTWPPRFLLGEKKKRKRKKRKCLKAHLAAGRSAAPRRPAAAAAAAAGESLTAAPSKRTAQQRHSRSAACRRRRRFLLGNYKHESNAAEQGSIFSRRQSFRTRRPIISLPVPRLALPSLAAALPQPRPSSVGSESFRMPHYTWTAKIKSRFWNDWHHTTKAT